MRILAWGLVTLAAFIVPLSLGESIEQVSIFAIGTSLGAICGIIIGKGAE